MIQEYVEFFTGKKIEVDIEEEIIEPEIIKEDVNLKFFKETDGYVLVPISDPISEDLRILHRGIFPTSSYFEERDRRRAKANKEKIIKEIPQYKNIKTKKKVTIIDRIKNIFAPFKEVKTNKKNILD